MGLPSSDGPGVGTQRVARSTRRRFSGPATRNEGDQLLEESSPWRTMSCLPIRAWAFLSSGLISKQAKRKSSVSFSSRASALFVNSLLVWNDHGRLIYSGDRGRLPGAARPAGRRMRVQSECRAATGRPSRASPPAVAETFQSELYSKPKSIKIAGGMGKCRSGWLVRSLVRRQLETIRDQIIAEK